MCKSEIISIVAVYALLTNKRGSLLSALYDSLVSEVTSLVGCKVHIIELIDSILTLTHENVCIYSIISLLPPDKCVHRLLLETSAT